MKNLNEFHKGINSLELNNYEFSERSRNTIGRSVSVGKILDIFILSCPDYSSNGREYTFEKLNEGVPLLARLHLENVKPILDLCKKENVRANIEVLIADVEAVNPALTEAYTGGSKKQYQDICDSSMKATQQYLDKNFSDYTNIKLTASSFLRRFEVDSIFTHNTSKNNFLKTRQFYVDQIKKIIIGDRILENKVLNNIRSKANTNYYQAEYAGLLEAPDFRIEQEILTMAEYMVLGKFIGNLATNNCQTMIITHSTANVHLFNSLNKINIAVGLNKPEVPSIPLAIYKRSVISND